MQPRQHKQSRPAGGFTLMEMLASALIMGLVGAGIAGLVILNGMTERRMSNKVDNLNAARTALERISRDVRMARNLGDVYGAPIQLQTSPVVWGIGGSNTFPAASNPIYPYGAPSNFHGWPPAPWPPGPNPGYTLSNQCLIVQVPVFDANGFPVGMAKGHGNPPLTANEDDVDTLVYMVVKDPSSPDSHPTFMLQVAGFPGPTSSLGLISNPPMTLVKGIIGPTANPGPVSLSNQPVCFQFLDKTLSGVAQDIGTNQNGLTNVNLTGVIVQFEVLNNAASASAPTVVGVKSEVYARNNNVQTVTATDDQLGSSGS